jgi:hypothetical protein
MEQLEMLDNPFHKYMMLQEVAATDYVSLRLPSSYQQLIVPCREQCQL